MRESHARSIAKGVTWRVIASFTTMTVVYVVTGDLTLVASVGIVDILAKIFFYYIHERTWGRVRWGIVGIEPQRADQAIEPEPERIILPTRD